MYYLSKNKESGFTLIELLIAMTISLIILAAFSGVFLMQRRVFGVQEQTVEMVQNARAAMDMMTREIRMAGFDPTGLAGAEIITARDYLIRFTMDITGGESDEIDNDEDGYVDEADEDRFGDGDTDDENEDITYTFDAANFQIDRDTGGGAQPFAENIEAFTFRYLDSWGNPTTIAAHIRQIEITITARTARPAHGDHYRRHTLTSVITPRNLGL